MTKKDFKDIVAKSDHGQLLLEEIESEIRKMVKRSSMYGKQARNNLSIVNKKIDFARDQGFNVDRFDDEILEYRITLFKRDVEHKIDELKESESKYSTNISYLKGEYAELKTEKNIDTVELEGLIYKLETEVIRARLKHQIKQLINFEEELDGQNVLSHEKVFENLLEAKADGIETSDLEEMIMT